MGGRGTFAAGRGVEYTYTTTDRIEGVKVLSGLNGKHSLPEEAHSSWAYIRLKPDGTFHEMRIYDKDHYLRYEIAYHPKPKMDPSRKPVLHYHKYDRYFNRTSAAPLPASAIKRLKKYLKGVPL